MDLAQVIAAACRPASLDCVSKVPLGETAHNEPMPDAIMTSLASPLRWSLGSSSLDAYYHALFADTLSYSLKGYLHRVFANFAVQQLATMSFMNSNTERFLQVGCFDPVDFAAAVVGGMPHTSSYHIAHGSSGLSREKRALDYANATMAPGDMASAFIVEESIEEWLRSQPDSSFGCICVYERVAQESFFLHAADFARLLNARGRILIFKEISSNSIPLHDISWPLGVEFCRDFAAYSEKGHDLRVTVLTKYRDVTPIQVDDWAPQEILRGKGVNIQADGSSAMWFRIRNFDAEAARVFVSFGDSKILRLATVSSTQISCEIPVDIVHTTGRHAISFVHCDGSSTLREDFVGILRVI